MRPTVFRALRDLAYAQAGIRLGDEKEALVSARVGKRLRALRLGDEEDYLDFLKRDASGGELVEFLDVISTNYTSFFREPAHFERLKAAMALWRASGQRRFRVWCAAASSGEEPYTIALVLNEVLGPELDWRILATDISTRVLGLARAGRYGTGQLKMVPPRALERAFTRAGDGRDGSFYEVSPELKSKVAFARLNLARPPFPMKGPFDVVFCRNVMIYFDNPVRQQLVKEMERLVRPGGLVLIGHAESLSTVQTGLTTLAPSVYQRPGGP
jgi:chemotaxis protein methyltransferase CheR